MVDYSISLGNILTIASFLVIVVVYITTVKGDTRVLNVRLATIDTQLNEFREELKKLTNVVIEQNRINDKMLLLDQRMLAEGKRVDRIEQQLTTRI